MLNDNTPMDEIAYEISFMNSSNDVHASVGQHEKLSSCAHRWRCSRTLKIDEYILNISNESQLHLKAGKNEI